jgi:two-component system, cell cycle response regulator
VRGDHYRERHDVAIDQNIKDSDAMPIPLCVARITCSWVARRGVWLLAALLLPYVVQLTAGVIPNPLGEVVTKWSPLVIFPAAAMLCGAHGLRRDGERAAWLLLAFGLLLWGFGITYFTIFQWDLTVIPTPSPADGFWLAVYPPWYAGVYLLFRARVGAVGWRVGVDGLIGALGMGAVAAAIVFDAVLHNVAGSTAAVITNLAYPVGDLLLLSLVMGVAIVGGRRIVGTFGWIAAGMCAFAVADSIYLYQSAVGSYNAGTPLEAGWAVSAMLIAVGASRPVSALLRREQQRVPSIAGPLAFGLAGLGLLIVDHFQRTNLLALALASLCVLAVLARLGVTFRDNVRMLSASRHEAKTDALTGIGNRRALVNDLEDALAAPQQSGPTMLILFDLNGFKQYNDAYGHPAGDALLARLGARQAAAVTEGGGAAYRMGGDEFCVLSPIEPHDGGSDLITRTTAALAEWGDGFSIDCSFGAVVLGEDCSTVEQALTVADRRMYEHKRSGRTSAGRQATDVLLRALAEHHPDLADHLDGVTELAVAAARKLALDPAAVEHIRLVAQLHDIGKVAIPNEIINKPGPLDDAEWAFMKGHTLIGERILLGAPALTQVAGAVRSSHERIDGGGYPDGLVGEEIPLASRVVFVADSFQAMMSQRSYRNAMAFDAAIEELRRCSGSQFDPGVVNTFVEVLTERQVTDCCGPDSAALIPSSAAYT